MEVKPRKRYVWPKKMGFLWVVRVFTFFYHFLGPSERVYRKITKIWSGRFTFNGIVCKSNNCSILYPQQADSKVFLISEKRRPYGTHKICFYKCVPLNFQMSLESKIIEIDQFLGKKCRFQCRRKKLVQGQKSKTEKKIEKKSRKSISQKRQEMASGVPRVCLERLFDKAFFFKKSKIPWTPPCPPLALRWRNLPWGVENQILKITQNLRTFTPNRLGT